MWHCSPTTPSLSNCRGTQSKPLRQQVLVEHNRPEIHFHRRRSGLSIPVHRSWNKQTMAKLSTDSPSPRGSPLPLLVWMHRNRLPRLRSMRSPLSGSHFHMLRCTIPTHPRSNCTLRCRDIFRLNPGGLDHRSLPAKDPSRSRCALESHNHTRCYIGPNLVSATCSLMWHSKPLQQSAQIHSLQHCHLGSSRIEFGFQHRTSLCIHSTSKAPSCNFQWKNMPLQSRALALDNPQ